MKGEGELHNLELDEKFLSELLELPPWLRLTKAVCNKISAKIHWTKLKTDPICLYLDRVEVNMEAVECSAHPASQQPRSTVHQLPVKDKAPNRYGFVEKVVDGMFVQINSVVISFKSSGFQASFQMSRLVVQSTNPDWTPDDLRQTRIKDEHRGEVLTFKEITWSTLRIDANALYDEKAKSSSSSPLRLITSHSALHLTIKKRLEDCAVLSARLELILDDILWVLTQTQLQALAGFANSINQAMERAEVSREAGASIPAGQAPQQPQYIPKKIDGQRDGASLNALFSDHDVPETSYHLRTGQIDFHLCDDSGLSSDERDPGANGAMHFQIRKLSLDHYPYHLAGTSRTCWPCHNEASLARAYWVNQLLNAFRTLRSRRSSSFTNSSTHHRIPNGGVDGRTGSDQPQSNPAVPPSPRLRSKVHVSPLTSPSSNAGPTNQRVGHSLSSAQKRPVFMYESCLIVRCEDFVIKQVTTSTSSGEGGPFLSSDKKALYLPSDMPAFQVDYTHYYYPSNNTSPVPCPNLFVQLNPIQFTFDSTTCLWFNRFLRRILENDLLSERFPEEAPTLPKHVDIRVEALMPKVIIPCPSDPRAHYSDLRPQALQAQLSQASMSNTRIGASSTQTDLLVFLQRFNASKLYSDFLSFPNEPDDTRPLPNHIWLNDHSVLSSGREAERLINGAREDFLRSKQAAQVWCMSAEQVWLDFVGIGSMGNRPMPFVDAVPISVWICTPLPGGENSTTEPSVPDEPSENSLPTVAREEVGQVRTRHWSPGPQSQIPKAFHSDLVAQRKLSEPVHLSPNSLQNSNSSPDLQPALGANGVGFDRTVYGRAPNCKYDAARPSETRVTRVCNSVPSSPRRARKDSSDNQALDGSSALKTSLRPCFSDSASVRSLPESDSSGSQDGFIYLERQPNDAPPAYEVFNDLPPPYEPYPRLQSPVQNGLAGSPSSDAAETALDGAAPLPVKAPPSFHDMACGSSDLTAGQDSNPGQQAGLSVLVSLTDKVNVRFDHFQLMFLLRMQEMLVNLQEELNRENSAVKRASQGEGATADVTCSILAQEVEFNVILPPKPEADASSSQNTSAMSGFQEADVLSDGRAESPESNSRLAPDKRSMNSELLSPHPKTRSTSSAESLQISRPGSAQSAGGASGRTSSASIPDTDGWSTIGQVGRRESDSGSSINLDSGVSLKDPESRGRRSSSLAKKVGIFAAEGSGLHVGIQLKEAGTVVTVTGQEVKIDELGTVHLEKYLNQKSLRTSREKEAIPVSPSSEPVVRVRAAFGPEAQQHELGGERGFAHVKITGVTAALLVSSIQGLVECFEDEVVLSPVPFLVELRDSRVTINNDLPPSLLSAPPSVPINVVVEDTQLHRDRDGRIHVKPIDTCSDVVATDVPQADNVARQDSIRSGSELSLSDSVSSRIESLENENHTLAAQLSVSRTALRSMHEERQALLHTVARLQKELLMSNREQERMQEKLAGQRRGGATKWY